MTMREDPPPGARSIETRPKGRPAVWDEHLAGAINQPGQWFKVAADFDRTHMRRLAMALEDMQAGRPRSKHNPKLPPGRWEFRYAHVPGNPHRVNVWARRFST